MDTNSQVRFGGVCVPYTLGHGYGWAQGLCPRNPLAVVIYRGMWSQGIQDGLTVMRNQRVLATQKNQPPQIQALSRSWGHTAIVHFSSWVLRKKKGLNQANCCRPGQGLSEFLRCPCILQTPAHKEQAYRQRRDGCAQATLLPQSWGSQPPDALGWQDILYENSQIPSKGVASRSGKASN